VLSPLLAPDLRRDFAIVYAYCRGLDDVADVPAPPEETPDRAEARRATALRDLAQWRRAVHAAFGADAAHATSADTGPSAPAPDAEPHRPSLDELAADPAFRNAVPHLFQDVRDLARRRSLSPEPFLYLVDAFERDQTQLVYRTWDDLLSYCSRSADPVGRIVLRLAGIDDRDPAHADLVADADRVCTALQLVNHWQGVRKDLLTLGRVYLPTEETGLTPDDLRAMIAAPNDPAGRVRYIKALRPLVQRTREMFESARGLPDRLRETRAELADGSRIAGPVWLFLHGGLAACRSVERQGCATLWRDARVGKAAKLRLLAEARIRFGRGRSRESHQHRG